MSTSFVDSDGTTRFRGEIEGGSVLGNMPTLQYLEWTPAAALTQTATFPSGTVVILGWCEIVEGFNGNGSEALDAGTGAEPDTYLNGATITTAGVLYTTTDLSSGATDPEGFTIGFGITTDARTVFPAGGTITGTVTLDGATTGIARLYFFACVPTAA